MSTLAVPAVSTNRIVRCSGCHTSFAVPVDQFVILPLCAACRRSHAEAEARRIFRDAVALRDGSGIFADLTPLERSEQLQQILGLYDQHVVVRFAKDMAKQVRELASDVLIDVVAHAGDEIARRLGSTDMADADRVNDPAYAPDSPLRKEIEDQLEDQARELAMASDGDRWDAQA